MSVVAAMLMLGLVSETALADKRDKDLSERAVPPVSNWQWSFALGVSSWSDLDDIQAADGSGFNSTGFSLDFSAHRKIADVGAGELLLGADLGFFSTSSDITGLRDDIVQRSAYITPSARLRFGEAGGTRVSLEAGAGWYNTDFAELDCDNVQTIFNPGGNPPFISSCTEVDQPFEDSAFGGHLGLRARFRGGITAGFRVHFADFGDVEGVTAGRDGLAGPIYTLSFGAAFGR